MVKFGIMNQAITIWVLIKDIENMKKDTNNRAALAQLVEQLICNQ